MRIVWNPVERLFEAEFQDFQNDLAIAKSAGFKTTGPPVWKWYTNKVAVLDKLRTNRPASLTILEDALLEYERLKKADDEKQALLKELKKAKKLANTPKEEAVKPVAEGREFNYNDVADVQGIVRVGYVPPVWTGPFCQFCSSPVYMYETQEPPTCLWCEIRLDNVPDLF